MTIIQRQFEVIGEGVNRLETLAEQRRNDQIEANAFAQQHGFDACALSRGIDGERVTGFVLPHDAGEPSAREWKSVTRIDDDRKVWMPKRTSKARRELSDQIGRIRITDRQDMLEEFGLKGWETMEPAGMSLRVVNATLGQLAGRWIVLVPESDDPDAKQFGGHEWLRELTLSEFREIQAENERRKEAEPA